MSTADAAEDPILEGEIERAMEPYKDMFPDAVLQTMREILAHALRTHPVGSELLNRVRPRSAPERSGAQAKEGAPEAVPLKKVGAK